MKKIAVVGAVLEDPQDCQEEFNRVVSSFKGIIKGRMGIPLEGCGASVISITVMGELDEINSLTGKLGRIPNVSVKTALSKNDY